MLYLIDGYNVINRRAFKDVYGSQSLEDSRENLLQLVIKLVRKQKGNMATIYYEAPTPSSKKEHGVNVVFLSKTQIADGAIIRQVQDLAGRGVNPETLIVITADNDILRELLGKTKFMNPDELLK